MPTIPPYVFIIFGSLLFLFALYGLLTYYKPRPGSVPERVQEMEDTKYHPQMSRWEAGRERKASEARGSLVNSLAIEGENLNKLESQKTEHHLNQALHNQQMQITELANRYEVDNPTYLAIIQKREFDKQDLEKRWVEIEQDLRAGFMYANKEKQYFKLFQEYIFSLYTERKKIELSDDLAKEEKVNFLTEYIQSEEEEFRERQRVYREQQKRLLSAPTQQDQRTGDEDTDLTRNPE
jgi:hypothetical protein